MNLPQTSCPFILIKTQPFGGKNSLIHFSGKFYYNMRHFAHKQLENQKSPQFFILHFLYLREKLKNGKLNFRATFNFSFRYEG